MDTDKKVERWWNKYMENGDPERVAKAMHAKGVRLRVVSYYIDGEKVATIHAEDSWFSKMSRVSKQLNEHFRMTEAVHPAWLLLASGQTKLGLDDILTMVEKKQLTYSGYVDESELKGRGGCDSWH